MSEIPEAAQGRTVVSEHVLSKARSSGSGLQVRPSCDVQITGAS
jgi:hypothetical protein